MKKDDYELVATQDNLNENNSVLRNTKLFKNTNDPSKQKEVGFFELVN